MKRGEDELFSQVISLPFLRFAIVGDGFIGIRVFVLARERLVDDGADEEVLLQNIILSARVSQEQYSAPPFVPCTSPPSTGLMQFRDEACPLEGSQSKN